MKAVMQTTFGPNRGNCFSACIASIMEIDIDSVPNFCDESQWDDGKNWFQRFEEWLSLRGWGYIKIWNKGGIEFKGNCYVIVTGDSPRYQVKHSIVGEIKTKLLDDGSGWKTWIEYLHDPHPHQTFIDGDPEEIEVIFPLKFGNLGEK